MCLANETYHCIIPANWVSWHHLSNIYCTEDFALKNPKKPSHVINLNLVCKYVKI